MVTVIRRGMSLLLLAGAFLAAGCDLFRPATPEPPSGGGIIPNYSSPSFTLQTIARAVEDKAVTNGQSVYIDAFADSSAGDGVGYHAFLDPVTEARMRASNITIPEDWDHGLEDTFYGKFVRRPQVPSQAKYIFQWTIDQTQGNDDSTATEATLHREYRVLAAVSETDVGTIAHGFVTMRFFKVTASRWAITRWQDREPSDYDPARGEVSMGERRVEP
jgi:hypothetical protein